MTRRSLRPVHLALVLALSAVVAAVLLPGRHTREDPADVLRALRASRGPSLPPAAAVGAASATAPARYAKDTLADMIDGAAEVYIRNGFVSAVMSTYAFERGRSSADATAGAGGAVEVAAEAHRFERDEGARAQGASEVPPRAVPVEGIPGATSDGAVLLVVAGRDLLKLTVLSPGDGGPEALAAIAGAWRKEQGR